jgi:hydroxyacylglutathione hydrolase
MKNLTIHPIKAFSDNYIWCIHDEKNAVVVDPGDPKPVQKYLATNNLTLIAILVTHHHPDHVGGIDSLAMDIPVFGPATETISSLTHRVQEGDIITIDKLALQFNILDVPGHTRGHIAYFDDNHLFCGDTLFSCGCGRLFEGTAEQMYRSLNKLARLPDETLVFCTHEYTEANIRFALEVESTNNDLLEYAQNVKKARANNIPSLPSTIEIEKKVNPFLRANAETVIQAANAYASRTLTSSVDVFSTIREWKNNF